MSTDYFKSSKGNCNTVVCSVNSDFTGGFGAARRRVSGGRRSICPSGEHHFCVSGISGSSGAMLRLERMFPDCVGGPSALQRILPPAGYGWGTAFLRKASPKPPRKAL